MLAEVSRVPDRQQTGRLSYHRDLGESCLARACVQEARVSLCSLDKSRVRLRSGPYGMGLPE